MNSPIPSRSISGYEKKSLANKFSTKNNTGGFSDWLKRMFVNSKNQLQVDQENSPNIDEYAHAGRSIRFTIYVANGGKIIECRRLDQRTGDHTHSLTVIGADEPLGDTIEKILTIEGLR